MALEPLPPHLEEEIGTTNKSPKVNRNNKRPTRGSSLQNPTPDRTNNLSNQRTPGPSRKTPGPSRNTPGPSGSGLGPSRSTLGPSRSTLGPTEKTPGPKQRTPVHFRTYTNTRTSVLSPVKFYRQVLRPNSSTPIARVPKNNEPKRNACSNCLSLLNRGYSTAYCSYCKMH